MTVRQDQPGASLSNNTDNKRAPGDRSLRGFGLHQIRKPHSDTSVLFIHGILSGGETAWGQPSWPELFVDEPELQDVGVFVFSYQTTLSSRSYSIGDVVDALREHFDLDGLWDQRRLAFVCHSLGGIVARRFVVVNQAELIKRNCGIGLFLVASPSLGASDANLIKMFTLALQHTQLRALRFSQSNTWLNDLDREFMTLKESGRLSITGKELVEDRAIVLKRWLGLRKQVVEPFSSGRYFGQAFKVPASDHISISKPRTSDAIQHRLLKRFIAEFAHPAADAGLVPTNAYETTQAYNAVGELRRKLDGVLNRREALAVVQEALLETRHYIEHRRAGGSRDAKVEDRLSQTWSEVGYAVQPYDPQLATICWVKGHGWADARLWDDPRFKDLPVQLNDVLQRLVAAMQDHVEVLQSDPAELRNGIEATQIQVALKEKAATPLAAEALIYRMGSLSVPYIPVQESYQDGMLEYHRQDVLLEIEPFKYDIPEEFKNNLVDYEPDNDRCGIVRFRRFGITQQGGHQKPVFRVRRVSYKDHLQSVKYFDKEIPGKQGETFRSKYAPPPLNSIDQYFNLPLPKMCGAGIFIITRDERIIITQRSDQLAEFAGHWSYSASGSVGWNDPPDLFAEIARECSEEINHSVDVSRLRLFSVGIDPESLVFQCSFVENSTRQASEISDGWKGAKTWEHSNLIELPFQLNNLVRLVGDVTRVWEPAALAGLLTLTAKRFGKDRVESRLVGPRSASRRERLYRSGNRRPPIADKR